MIAKMLFRGAVGWHVTRDVLIFTRIDRRNWPIEDSAVSRQLTGKPGI
jgi:hypothetical protein